MDAETTAPTVGVRVRPASFPPHGRSLSALRARPSRRRVVEGRGHGGQVKAEGVRSVLVTCTGGEEGDILNPAMDRPEVRDRLAEVRRDELARGRGSSATTRSSCSATATRACPTAEANARPDCFANADLARPSVGWSRSSGGNGRR